MASLDQLYSLHITQLNQRVAQACQRERLSGLLIHAGKLHRQFLDDMEYPFKVNPHFKAWLPLINNPDCWVVADGINKPVLIYYRPVDFWHKVEDLPQTFWTEHFEIKLLTQTDKVAELLPRDIGRWAYIGEDPDTARALGVTRCNPENVLNYLHFHRSFKTDYELECIREANRIAVKGHAAAKAAFSARGSEVEIQRAYLTAIGQGENQVPYNTIIALNENAAILHYMVPEYRKPPSHRSFLIDAGAGFGGYASDITRTYSCERNRFAELIEATDKLQSAVIAKMKPGVSYVDLHIETHQLIAQVLLDFDLAVGTPEGLIEQGVTAAFFPHGLGHMLGLQVHDVAGFSHDDRGAYVAAPAEHGFLRCTRILAERQVLTVEPGLYIIDSLLDRLKQDRRQRAVNWNTVDELRPYGGIRIEDNVIIHADGVENITRDLGLN